MSRGGGTQGLKGKKIPGDTPDRAKRFYPLVGSTEEIAPAKALMGMVWSVMCPGPVTTVLNNPSPPKIIFLTPFIKNNGIIFIIKSQGG